jgi:hypothetical protein
MANSGPDTNKYVVPFEAGMERRTLIRVVLERNFQIAILYYLC